jgi:hypothetical protein
MQKIIDVSENNPEDLNHLTASPASLNQLRDKAKFILGLALEVEKSIRNLMTALFAIRIVQILTSFVIVTALFYAFLIYGVDAQETENQGRYQANQKYIQLVEAKNPEGIYISK